MRADNVLAGSAHRCKWERIASTKSLFVGPPVTFPLFWLSTPVIDSAVDVCSQ